MRNNEKVEMSNNKATAASSISDQLSAAFLRALELAIASQKLPTELALPREITLERPKNRDHGDYAT